MAQKQLAKLFSGMVLMATANVVAAPLVGPGQDSFDRQVGAVTESGRTLNYEFFRPPGHDDPGELPMIVYLHGFTDGLPTKQSRLNDTMRDLVHTTQRDNESRGGICVVTDSCQQFDDDFASYLLVPKIPVASGWQNYRSNLSNLVNDFVNQYEVDTNRIYLSGFSNGGIEMPGIIEQSPGFYSAGFSLSGGLFNASASVVNALTEVPLWFFHGTQDGAVNPQRSVNLANAINAAGGDARLTLINGGHNVGYEVAFRDSNNEFYPWLFSQSLPEPESIDALIAVDFQGGASTSVTQHGFAAIEASTNSTASLLSAIDIGGTGIDIIVAATGGGFFQGRGISEGRFEIPDDPLSDLLRDSVSARNGDGGVELTLSGLEAGTRYLLTLYHNDAYIDNRGFAEGTSNELMTEYYVETTPVSGVTLFDVIAAGSSDNLPFSNGIVQEELDPTVFSFVADSRQASFRLQSDAATRFLTLSGFVLQAIPEPSTAWLLGTGIVWLGFHRP